MKYWSGNKRSKSSWTKSGGTGDQRSRIQGCGHCCHFKSIQSQVSTIMCHQWWHRVIKRDRWGQQQDSTSLSTCTIKTVPGCAKWTGCQLGGKWVLRWQEYLQLKTGLSSMGYTLYDIQLGCKSQYLHGLTQLMIMYLHNMWHVL